MNKRKFLYFMMSIMMMASLLLAGSRSSLAGPLAQPNGKDKDKDKNKGKKKKSSPFETEEIKSPTFETQKF